MNAPVIPTNAGKDSELFQLFTEYWRIIKENINGKDGYRKQDYWGKVFEETELLKRKYPKYKELTEDLVGAFYNEILRREQNEIDAMR